MVSKKQRTALLVGCGLTAFTAAPHARAVTTTLFNSQGFEPSGGYVATSGLYGSPTTGTVPNQFSGANFGSGTAFPTASIQSYAASFPVGSINNNPLNTQFAEFNDTSVASGNFAEYYPETNLPSTGGTLFTATPSQNVVDVVFTMSVTAASAGEPFFGVIAYAGNSPGDTPIAELGVDANTGTVIGNSTYTGAGASFAPGTGALNFYSYELQLNYGTQSYTMYEATPGSGAFTNEIGAGPFFNSATTFSYAALSTLDLPGGAGSADSTYSALGLFDDYSVTAVPEPASLSVFVAVSALGMSRARRRRFAN